MWNNKFVTSYTQIGVAETKKDWLICRKLNQLKQLCILYDGYANALKNNTPHEAWNHKKTSFSPLRIWLLWLCSYCSWKRKVLDPKSQPCNFVRYSETNKASNSYNPKTRWHCLDMWIFWRANLWEAKTMAIICGRKSWWRDWRSLTRKMRCIFIKFKSQGKYNFAIPSNKPNDGSKFEETPEKSSSSIGGDQGKAKKEDEEVVNYTLVSRIEMHPSNFEEATKNQAWKMAIQGEINSTEKKQT